MAAVLTGTPVAVALSSGSASITIPSDATAVYVSWSYYNATAAKGLTSATLNGVSPSQNHNLQTAATDLPATGVLAWYNPATGARTLVMTFDTATTEGPTIIATFVKGGDTSAWRDVKSAHGNSSGQITVTVTTVSGDLVIKHDQRNDAATTPPSTSVGWTASGGISNVNQEHAQVEYISATTTTQVANSEDENYSTLVAWSIPAAAGHTITTGQPSETDTAQTATVGKLKAIGQPSETDSSQPLVLNGNTVFLTVAKTRELRNHANVVWASVSGWIWAWYDVDLFGPGSPGAPVGTGTFNTNASGEAIFSVPGTTLTSGQSGTLLLRHPSYPSTPVQAMLSIAIGP